jgi:hypothetical protein
MVGRFYSRLSGTWLYIPSTTNSTNSTTGALQVWVGQDNQILNVEMTTNGSWELFNTKINV